MLTFCLKPLRLIALVLLVSPSVIVGPAQAQQTGTVTGQMVDLETRDPLGSTQVSISDLGLGVLKYFRDPLCSRWDEPIAQHCGAVRHVEPKPHDRLVFPPGTRD